MPMNASVFIKGKRGYFPVAIIDFEKGTAVIYNEKRREKIKILDINSLRIHTSIPLTITSK